MTQKELSEKIGLTDHHVFPCALTIGTYMAARKRDDRKLRFYSMNFEKLGVVESSLDEFLMGKEGNWTAYPKGMMWAFCQKGFPVEQGFDIVLYGNIPNGSGLSSSASVETVTGVMLRDMFGYDTISMIDIALYGQFSENNYNGVNCGIMDQFAIAMGKKDCAIFLDTSDLKYEYAPVKLEGARIVISCSNKKRGLGDSKYNERRSECETALADSTPAAAYRWIWCAKPSGLAFRHWSARPCPPSSRWSWPQNTAYSCSAVGNIR